MKRYKVTLTTEERCELRDLIAAGKAAAKKLALREILLKADASPSGPCLDRPTHRRGGRSWRRLTVERVRQPFRGGGLGGSLGPQEAVTDPAASTASSMAGPRLA